MGYLNIEVLCEKCDERYDMLVDREQRNDPQLCDLCEGGHAFRVWSVPNVSTTKTSESIPEGVASGRFDQLREQHAMRKELSEAKAICAKNPTKENHEQVKRLRVEKKKVEGKS